MNIKVYENIMPNDINADSLRKTSKISYKYNWDNNHFYIDNIPNKLSHVPETIHNHIHYLFDYSIYNSFIIALSGGQEYFHRPEKDIIRVVYYPHRKWMPSWGGMISFQKDEKKHDNIRYAVNSNPIKTISKIEDLAVVFDSNIICHEHILSKYYAEIKILYVMDFIKK